MSSYADTDEYITHIDDRRRPTMFATKLSNVINVIKSNTGYERYMRLWKRQGRDFIYIGEYYIDDINMGDFIEMLDSK